MTIATSASLPTYRCLGGGIAGGKLLEWLPNFPLGFECA